jgi:hypothetical protein
MQNLPLNHRSAASARASVSKVAVSSPPRLASDSIKPAERLERDRDHRASARDRDVLFECTRLLHELTRDGSLTRPERKRFEAELAKLSLVPDRALILELRASLRRLYTL